ncbi:MAG: hypothetical protein JSU08_07755 [Acidobacteria bacterium]|nr:hypothetical protein [Acidobacteriota bacterium]
MRKCTRLLWLPLLLGLGGCELTKTENPLSPSVAGPIAGVDISAPKLLEPASGALISGDRQPITLLIENASSTGQRPLNYSFEVSTDPSFSNKVFQRDGISPGDNGRTALTLPNALGSGRGYYWRSRAQDGANTGPFSAPVGFNIFTPVAFDKPVPISPVANAKVSSYTPEFRFANAPRQGSPSLVSYVIEVSTNSAFAGIIAAWQFPEQANETKFTAASGLPPSSQLYWRVRAFEGGALGPWSDTASFVTPTPVAPPSGGGGTGAGAACSNTSQLGIVTCRRNQFTGHMDAGQVIVFLKGIASDLNKAGTWGTGYGLLRKSSGSSCGGYSCDIICQGSGTSQKQYDVLIDSDGTQGPIWGGPKVYPDIRMDSCDVP